MQLAPAIAALVGIGSVVAWRHRAQLMARIALATGVAVTAWWSWELLGRSAGWNPWLRSVILVGGLVAAAVLLVPPVRLVRVKVGAAVLAVLALITVGGGSAAYAVNTAGTAHTGSIPTAGPATSTSGGGFAGRGGFPGGTRTGTAPTGNPPTGGGFPGTGTRIGTGRPAGQPAVPRGGGVGGGGVSSNSAVTALLKAAGTKWSAATTGDQSAAGLELSSGTAVMAIGGWSGSDPTPTLAQFQEYVKVGLIHYYIGGGQGGGGAGGNSDTASAIAEWVSSHYTAKTVGGQTVYDLTATASS